MSSTKTTVLYVVLPNMDTKQTSQETPVEINALSVAISRVPNVDVKLSTIISKPIKITFKRQLINVNCSQWKKCALGYMHGTY